MVFSRESERAKLPKNFGWPKTQQQSGGVKLEHPHNPGAERGFSSVVTFNRCTEPVRNPRPNVVGTVPQEPGRKQIAGKRGVACFVRHLSDTEEKCVFEVSLRKNPEVPIPEV